MLLEKLELRALRDLYAEESRAFLLAIDIESSYELSKRRERIRQIDLAIISKKAVLKNSSTLTPEI